LSDVSESYGLGRGLRGGLRRIGEPRPQRDAVGRFFVHAKARGHETKSGAVTVISQGEMIFGRLVGLATAFDPKQTSAARFCKSRSTFNAFFFGLAITWTAGADAFAEFCKRPAA
jgi:hypothetical protein